MPKLILITLIMSLSAVVLALPVLAQTSAEPVLQPDGSYVIPGEENQNPQPEQPGASEEEKKSLSQQGFVSGIAVGAAVGFVGGSVIAWFLKPGKLKE